MLNNAKSDPFSLFKGTKPQEKDIDVVAALEADLRSDKKQDLNDNNSQQLGGSALISPDTGLPNTHLLNMAAKYAPGDNVQPSPGIANVQADFSRLLGGMSQYETQNGGAARSNLMAMAVSTLQNGKPNNSTSDSLKSDAQRIIEAQLNYELASPNDRYEMASKQMHLTPNQFNLHNKEKRAYRRALDNPLMANAGIPMIGGNHQIFSGRNH